ncbi:MAG: GAF domain-containing protein [Polyangiaceae bacterium]|nr:GAF domain-containing protein [Polyangiaceae bacterium]
MAAEGELDDFTVFDTSPLCTVVVRGGDVAYVNDATLRLVRRERAAIVGHPFVAFVAPGEAERLLERYRRRQRGEPVPAEYTSKVLTSTGELRDVDVFASYVRDHTIVMLRDRTESAGRERRLLALAELGAGVLRERTPEAIYRKVDVGLGALGLASALGEPRGEDLYVVGLTAFSPLEGPLAEALGPVRQGVSRPWSSSQRAAWRDGGVYLDDAPLELAGFLGGALGERAREAVAAHGLARGAGVRIDVDGVPARLLLLLGRWLRREDLPILRLLASQISAALGASRAIADLSGRNEALAALNRLAQLASTSPDLKSLFRAGSDEVARVTGCDAVAIYIVDEAGQAADLVHQHGGSEEAGRLFARIPLGSPTTFLWRVAHGGEALVFRREDYPEPARSVIARMRQEVVASIPLVARSKVVGVMNVAYVEPVTVDAAMLDLLKAMGTHFAAAVEAQRLLDQLRSRVSDLALLYEVGWSLVATLEHAQVLDLGVRNLARSVGAADAFLLLPDEAGKSLVIRAVAGEHRQLVGRDLPLDPPASVAAVAFAERAPVVVDDASADPRVDPALRAILGAHAYLGLPLVVRDRSIGAVVIATRGGPRPFGAAEVDRAAAVANQIAVAVENARLYADLRASYEELAKAQAQLVERERLAALGQLAAVVAHEVRNPLGAIFSALGPLKRQLRLEGESATLFAIVGQEAERLNRIVGDLLDFARPSAPTLRPLALGDVLEHALAAALGASPPAVRIVRVLDPALPSLQGDEHLLHQAFLNLALNALQAMPDGGTLTVRAGTEVGPAGAVVRVEISDTGVGLDDDAKARLFEPFFTTKAAGTGLGLAVVKRIVEGHRGSIDVASESRRGTTFTLRLPLAPG